MPSAQFSTTPYPVGAYTSIQVASKAVFGQMIHRGWSWYFTGNYSDEVRNGWYPMRSDMDYNTTLRAWMLLPIDHDFWMAGAHMRPNDWAFAGQTATATVAGTITTAGTVTLMVTSAWLPASPMTFAVAVGLGDTAITVAGKVVAALAADVFVSAYCIASVAGASAKLAYKDHAINDQTFNVSVANGTCAGLTAAPLSALSAPDFISFTPNMPGAKAYLKRSVMSANVASTVTSTFDFPASPTLVLSFLRAAWVPSTQTNSDVVYSISFGGGYTFQWSHLSPPTLTTPASAVLPCKVADINVQDYAMATGQTWIFSNHGNDLYIQGSGLRAPWIIPNVGLLPAAPVTLTGSGGGWGFNFSPGMYQNAGSVTTKLIETFDVQDDDTLQSFFFPPTIPTGCTADITVAATSGTMKSFTLALTGDSGAIAQTAIATVLGTLVTTAGSVTVTITSDLLPGGSKSYVIPTAWGDLPATVAPNIVTVLLADPMLTLNYGVANGAAEQFILTSTNPCQTDATLNIGLVCTGVGLTNAPMSTAGTAILGSWTTPAMQAWEPMYPPRFSTGAGTWFEISPWMVKGHEELPADLSTRKTTFTFKHQEPLYGHAGGPTLLNYVGALTGQWAVKYATGYRMSDGSVIAMQRMVGIMATRGEKYRAGQERPTLDCGVYDRYIMFQKSLCFAPCLFGYRVDQALSLLAAWCGLLPADIAVDSDFETAFPWYLTDPGRGYLSTPTNYGTPPYKPGKADTGAQWMKQICERYPGLRCEFQPDGLLHIYVEPASRPVASVLTTAIGASPLLSVAGIEFNTDTTGVENTIITEGETPSYANTFQGGDLISGLPMYEVSQDADSINIPGADNYTGEVNVRWVSATDIKNTSDLALANEARFKRRNNGLPVVILDCGQWAGWSLMPSEWITIHDLRFTACGIRVMPIKSMSVDLGVSMHHANITLGWFIL